MLVPLSYNLRSLFIRKSATFLTVLGIGATVAIISGVLALQQGFTTMFTSGGREDVAVFLRPGSTNEGDSQFSRDRGLTLMKRVPEIEVGPQGPIASMEAYLAVLLPRTTGNPEDKINVPLRGVQPMSFEIRKGELSIVEGRNFTPGSDEVIVGKGLTDRIQGCRVGDVIKLNKSPFRVVGVFAHSGQYGNEIWGDLDRLLATFERYGPNRVIAKLKPNTNVGAPNPSEAFRADDPQDVVASILEKKISKEDAKARSERLFTGLNDWTDMLAWTDADFATKLDLGEAGTELAPKVRASLEASAKKLEPAPGSLAARLKEDREIPAKVMSEAQYLESQTGFLSFELVSLGIVLGMIMGLAAIFTATNTMLSALAARTHEIGILLAMGFRPVPIFLSFMFEAVVLGLIGGLVGCALSMPFNGIKTGTTNFQTFTETAFAFRVTPTVLIFAVTFSLLLGLAGGALPAWRAARLRPTEALRSA